MTSFLTIMIVMAAITNPLQPCPSSPNCVSSQAADTHFIKPFMVAGDIRASFEKLKDILERRSDTTIISADNNTIKVEFRTTLGFVDDGIFLLDEINKQIHIRSASRSGYWDLGKNRRRIEEIREDLQNE